MARKLKSPTDPEMLEAILRDIRETTREEWIEELSKFPDWDPAWAGNGSEESPSALNGSGNAHLEEFSTVSVARS